MQAQFYFDALCSPEPFKELTIKNPAIQFIKRGEIISLCNVPPTRTLLEVLREDLNGTGTKEGCNEGDCGACTVVLGEADGERIQYSAVNSCIRLAHSINGLALWTAEDLAAPDGTLHPAQQAQSGNLCRCTGYRPILDATQHMAALPMVRVDEPSLLQKLELLTNIERALEADSSYISPPNLSALLAARAASPDAQIVAGCTDVGLWVNKLHQQFAQVLDVSKVQELRQIEQHSDHTPLPL